MNINEMRQAVKLLSKEWDLGKRESDADGNICAWIYMFEILRETEKIFVYKDNHKLVGFAGYSNNKSKKHILRKKICSFVGKALCHSKKIRNKEGLKVYLENYEYTPDNLKECFDGEVSILLVDKEYRGKGIGKKLLQSAFDAAKKDGMRNVKILTDESCNFQFYETMGCVKVYDTIVKNLECGKLGIIYEEAAYIFEKKLN